MDRGQHEVEDTNYHEKSLLSPMKETHRRKVLGFY